MRVSAIFSVSDFTPADVPASLPVTTATPTGVATMVKRYDGEAVGRSATLFTVDADGTHRVWFDYDLG